MKIVFVDACMKAGEESRTKVLCNAFLEALRRRGEEDIRTVTLRELGLTPFDMERVNLRYDLLGKKEYAAPMFDLARELVGADRVIIGAPYWDLAFPAVLKIYIEHIFVEGITFAATAQGLKGLCQGEKLLYIQTSGGYVPEQDPGTLYLQYVFQTLGIPIFQRIAADGIDVQGADIDGLMAAARKELETLAKDW